MVLIDISPLRNNRNYRFLYSGQFISSLGGRLTYVAIPYQVYYLTKSSFAVGLVSLAQLVPLILTSLLGGALADSVNRKRLLITAELGLLLCSLALGINSSQSHPSIAFVFIVAAIMSSLVGLHRPSLEAITSKVIEKNEITAVSALNSLRTNITMIAGPGIAGLLIAGAGIRNAFLLDALSYLIAAISILPIQGIGTPEGKKLSLNAIAEGFSYAKSRHELLGTYFVDFIAMLFGMPMALFPAMAEPFGGAIVVGWFYSAPSFGALVANIFSGWTKHVYRHGVAITLAAIAWGLAIIAFGLSKNIYVSLFFLALAGAADMVSVQFRFAIWRQTIPDYIRGRMASIEVLSYLTGPLLGDAEAGLVAKLLGVTFSVVSGGAFCVVGVIACVYFLPKFWHYDARNI